MEGILVGQVQITGNDGSSKLKVNGDGTLPVVQADQNTGGTITTNGANVEFDLKDGVGTIEFFLAGTFTAGSTIVFEQSADNTNWVSMAGRITGAITNEPVTSVAGPGPLAILCNGVSAAHVRARATSFQAGDSINVTIRSSVGTTAVSIDHSLPPGNALIGGVNMAQIGGVATQMATANGVAYTNIPETALGLDNGTSLDKLVGLNGFASIEQMISYYIRKGQGFSATTGIVTAGAAAGLNGLSVFNPLASGKTLSGLQS